MTPNKPKSFVAVRSDFFRTCLSISRHWWGLCLWKPCLCGVWSAPGDRRLGALGSSKGTRTTARGREERLSIWVTMMLSAVPGYRGTGRRVVVVALARMNPIDFCCCLYFAPPPSSKSILQILHSIPRISLMLNFLIVILLTTISFQSVEGTWALIGHFPLCTHFS